MTIVHEDLSVPPLLANAVSFVADPVYADTVEIDRDLVCVAGPTTGPNRYTMHVPTEHSVLSLGQQSPKWKTDKGIVGYTDSHVHFETKVGAQTIVSLGGPALRSSVKGYGDAAPVATKGYSMVTLQNAWHDSQLQHYLLSTAADVTLRTLGESKRVVIQAERGKVAINGGTEVNVAGGGVAVGARQGLPFENVLYAESFSGEVPHSIGAKRNAQFMGITNAVVIAHNLIMAAAKLRKEYKEGHLHASVDTIADVVEWVADLGEFLRTAAEVKELFGHEEAVEGSIKMDAAKDFGVSAGGSASFFGIHGASLISTVWTSVSGGVSGALKGALFAGVAATYTSLKGYKSIELGCDHGKSLFNAKKTVQISADNSIIAVGKTLAQVSGEKNAYFTGGDKAWLGVSAGGGWGMLFDSTAATIGKATAADTMASATIVADRSIKIDKGDITITSASSVMTLTKKAIETKATSIKFHAKDSTLRVSGKKVLVDGP